MIFSHKFFEPATLHLQHDAQHSDCGGVCTEFCTCQHKHSHWRIQETVLWLWLLHGIFGQPWGMGNEAGLPWWLRNKGMRHLIWLCKEFLSTRNNCRFVQNRPVEKIKFWKLSPESRLHLLHQEIPNFLEKDLCSDAGKYFVNTHGVSFFSSSCKLKPLKVATT